MPGAFTGRIEARMLTPEELGPSLDKRHQVNKIISHSTAVGQFCAQIYPFSSIYEFGTQVTSHHHRLPSNMTYL